MITLKEASISYKRNKPVLENINQDIQPGRIYGLLGRKYMFGLIAVPYIGWAFGTLAGALLGGILPLIVRESLGIAIYGMFIAIIIPVARRNHCTGSYWNAIHPYVCSFLPYFQR